jgi:Kef-type K+ transport system membrane component KefB/Trk K+ transport system NAD-binding subunit
MGHELLAAIAVSVVAAAALALLARTLRQPLILGYIAGGVVLGRHLGFGVVSDEASIEVISEIGLIFLLFIIGLEIDVPRVLQAGRTILVLGILQFPLCAGLAWYALSGAAAQFGGPLDGLYLAVALALSSTLIVVKLIYDKLEIATLAGRLTLGILIFQDLWAIAFMALQPNLDRLGPGPLFASLGAGALLVATAAFLSRSVLPTLFRAIATSHELVLISAIAWCFLVAGVAGWIGLSVEMGALLAGLVLAAFPYGMEVVARLSGVRDFFVTLFFVTLGLKMPAPSRETLWLAGAAALVVIASRLVVIFPLAALLRLDVRTATVLSINLAQVSEFSLVILGIGAAYDHVSSDVSAVVLYTLLLTAVLSTYGILHNHTIAAALGRAVAKTGLPQLMGQRRPRAPAAAARHRPDVFLLGCSREGLAFLERLERGRHGMKGRILAIDFNPETLERLQADGVECVYGDVSHPETLRMAGIEHASVVVSSVPDSYLRGTTNLMLLRVVRALAPRARVIVTGETLATASALYSEGAHYVLIPPALAAAHLYDLLAEVTDATLAAARQRQAVEVFRR